MSIDVYYDFLTKNMVEIIFNIYDWILSWCKLDKKSNYNNFIVACHIGDLKGCEKFFNEEYTNDGLFYAIKNGHVSVVNFLTDKNVNLDNSLIIACKHNKIEIIKLLVKKGANLNVGIRYAETINIRDLLFKARRNEEI